MTWWASRSAAGASFRFPAVAELLAAFHGRADEASPSWAPPEMHSLVLGCRQRRKGSFHLKLLRHRVVISGDDMGEFDWVLIVSALYYDFFFFILELSQVTCPWRLAMSCNESCNTWCNVSCSTWGFTCTMSRTSLLLPESILAKNCSEVWVSSTNGGKGGQIVTMVSFFWEAGRRWFLAFLKVNQLSPPAFPSLRSTSAQCREQTGAPCTVPPGVPFVKVSCTRTRWPETPRHGEFCLFWREALAVPGAALTVLLPQLRSPPKTA